MLKCFKFDKLPDGVIEYIKTEQYYTKASLKLYVGMDFGDKVGDLEVGPSYVIAEVLDDYVGEYNLSQLLEKSFKIRAYSYTSLASLQDTVEKKFEKLLENEKFRETELGSEVKGMLDKAKTYVSLIAPVAVTFRMSELPADFPGNLHKFKDKDYMCKVMSDDYIGFERTPDSIEPEVYYVCLVLLQDYQGKLDYDYFVKSLQHEKLAAYCLEAEKGKQLSFRYKNKYYDK